MDSWSRYRRLRRLALVVWALWLPFIGVLLIVPRERFQQLGPVLAVVGVVWGPVFAVFGRLHPGTGRVLIRFPPAPGAATGVGR